MYDQIHAQLFESPHSAQPANDGALTSAALLIAAELDQDPPTTRDGVREKLVEILGDSYAARAIRYALR